MFQISRNRPCWNIFNDEYKTGVFSFCLRNQTYLRKTYTKIESTSVHQ